MLILFVFSVEINPVKAASSSTDDEFYFLNNQGDVWYKGASNYSISGMTTNELPFFTYRIEGYDSNANYFYGTTEEILPESLKLSQITGYWEWKIVIDNFQGTCSCLIHISQLNYGSEVLASKTLSVWINELESNEDSLFYPLVIPHISSYDSSMDSNLIFNNEIEIFADLYLHPSNPDEFDFMSSQEIPVSIIDVEDVEIDALGNNSIMNQIFVSMDESSFKLHFTMSLENYSEGKYQLMFDLNEFFRWDVRYDFIIDKSSPIALINGENNVFESLEWMIIDASSSFDNISFSEESIANDLIFSWVFEDPSGKISIPTEEMFLTESKLQFLPINQGDYNFTVYVRDKAGNENSTSLVITVQNLPPIAKISDSNGEVLDDLNFDYNSAELESLFFNGNLSIDSQNEIHELQYGWYLDGLLYSSKNFTEIKIIDLKPNSELELIVKDSDGGSDKILINLNQLDFSDRNSENINLSNSNFFNGLNLVLLTTFICTIVLLMIRKKSNEVDPLPKWSKHNKKQ